MSRLLILGTFHNHELNSLAAAGTQQGLEVTTKLFSELQLRLDTDFKNLITEFEGYDYIVSRVEGTLSEELRTILVTSSESIRRKLLNGESYYKYPSLTKIQQYAVLAANNIPIPETWYQGEYNLDQIALPIILKGIKGSKGNSVHLIQTREEFDQRAQQYGKGGFVLQTPLPLGQDYRIVVLHGEVIGFMKKIATEGFVTNIHAGGQALEVDESQKPILAELAIKTAHALSCEFGGVDVMFDDKGQPRVLEINRGAAYAGFESVNPIDVSDLIISYLQTKTA